MKNWIISLIVLTLPVVAYFGLKNDKEIQQSLAAQAANKPSVIKFSSPMCADCKKIKIEFDSLKPTYSNEVNFVEIDATKNDKKTQEQIEMYGVTLVPTIIFLDEKNYSVKKIEGFTSKDKLEQCIKELING